MKKLFVLLSMAAVVAVLVAGLSGAIGNQDVPSVYASRLAGIQSAGKTGIQVQNLDQAQDAQISADFYPQDGTDPIQINAPTTAAGAAASYYLPTIPNLPDGAYAAIINSDRQIAAIARTDWDASGGAATYSNVIPGTDVAVPLALKNYAKQCSLVSIQNTSTSGTASARLEIFAAGQASAVFSQAYPIARGTSATFDLCSKEEIVAGVPDDFVGSIRVKSEDGTTKFGVQSFIDITSSKQAVYAFEGVPVENAASDLFAPLFRARQPFNPNDPATKYMDTGISVVNPGTSAVDVTVTYYGAQGACVGQTYTQSGTIPASSSAVFYQGPAAQPITGRHNLPNNCVGSAKISAAAGGKILAIVNDSLNYTDQSAAYNAVSAEGAGATVALPLFRAGHTAWNLWTGISAMNVGAGATDITLAATNKDGTVTSGLAGMTIANVAPFQTALFWPAMVQKAGGPWAQPANAYGSATITSAEPVAVIVNDVSLAQKADSSTYNGIAAGQ
jgi:hypothetical protein